MAQHPTPEGTNRPKALRRRGVRRWLLRGHKLHPIRDRALIDAVLPLLYAHPGLPLDEAKRLAGFQVDQEGTGAPEGGPL